MTDVVLLTTKPTWQTASISRILPRPFVVHAGQHVDVRLTAPDGYQAGRRYSIASASGEMGELELAVERMNDGEVSTFFSDGAEVVDEIELRGPLGGHFIWFPGDGGPLLLMRGGSGLVPVKAMIRRRQQVASTLPTTVLLSARAWDDVLYRDELLAL